MRSHIVLLTGLLCCVSCGSDDLGDDRSWPISDRLNDPTPMPSPEPLPDPSPGFRQISAWVGGEHIGNCIEDVSFMRFGEGGQLQAAWLENNLCVDDVLRGLYRCNGEYKISGEDFSMDCSSSGGKGFEMSAAGTAWQGEIDEQPYLGLGVFWGEPLTGGDSGRWSASFSRELRKWPQQSLGSFVESFELVLSGLDAPMLMGGDFPELGLKGQFKIGDAQSAHGGSFDMPLRVYIDTAPTGGQVVSFVEFDAQYPEDQWQQILERKSGLSTEDARALARLIPIRYRAISLYINGSYQWVLAPFNDTAQLYPRLWRGSDDICEELGYFVENAPDLRSLCQR